jgi:hypothetical protein
MVGSGGLRYAAAALLIDCALGGRDGFETSVGDRTSAQDREAVSAGFEARLGSLNGSKLVPQVRGATRIELILVEILRVAVAGFALIGSLERAVLLDRREVPLDA